jgi:hypothetical protein
VARRLEALLGSAKGGPGAGLVQLLQVGALSCLLDKRRMLSSLLPCQSALVVCWRLIACLSLHPPPAQALAQLRFPGSPFSRMDDLSALAWQALLKSACPEGGSSGSSCSDGPSAGSSLDPTRCLALLWQLQAADSAEGAEAFGVLAAEVKAAAGRLPALPGAACRPWRRLQNAAIVLQARPARSS